MNVFNDILGIKENQSEPPADLIQTEMKVLEEMITSSQMKRTEAIDAVLGYLARFRVDANERNRAEENEEYYESTKLTFQPRRKGIALIGGVGCGKSVALEAVSRITRCRVRAVPKMAIQFAVKGAESLKEYVDYASPLIIDDIGAEKQMKSFGSAFPIEEIIYMRYNIWQKTGIHTHFATNLNAKEFEERYGVRILDRVKEMCAVTNLTGGSLRC